MGEVTEVVFVDDDEALLGTASQWLTANDSGVRVVATARSVDELLSSPRRDAGIAILDLRLRDGRTPGENVAPLVAAGFTVITCSSHDEPRLIREAIASGHEKILVDGQLSPGSRTPEFRLGGQVISVSAT